MGAFYKLVVNGSYSGKDNKNVLWYRAAFDPMDGALGMGGAEALADAWEAGVKTDWLDAKPSGYVLETIDITPYNDLVQAFYQLPYSRAVSESGHQTLLNAQGDSPAICANFRFNLEPTLIGTQTLMAPKRGYLAIGPLPSAWIGDDGQIIPGMFVDDTTALGKLGVSLTKDLSTILPPTLFFPCRMSSKVGPGGIVAGIGLAPYADVQGGTWDRYVSFRRSRRVTG
jgi:hypothetical protein